MIKRIVENWLTKTKERDFQIPFCQVLQSQGHRILYVSRHGILERGKDIVSRDGSGQLHVYQLKTGDIDLSTWRSIEGELNELVELPYLHPDVVNGERAKCWLVLNGELNDGALDRLLQKNTSRWNEASGFSNLHIKSIHDLVDEFVEAFNDFFVSDPVQFENFLALYNSDGCDNLSVKKLWKFLVPLIEEASSKRARSRSHVLTGTVITSAMILGNFLRAENHYAVAQGLIVTASAILGGCKNGLCQDDYETLKTLENSIVDHLDRLKGEVLSKSEYFEGDIFGDGGIVYQFRVMILIGVISALELRRLLKDPSCLPDPTVINWLKSHLGEAQMWGEGAVPSLVMTALVLIKSGNADLGRDIIREIAAATISSNALRSGVGIPDPYYSADHVLETLLALPLSQEIDFRDFTGNSYCLKSCISLLVLMQDRDFLTGLWNPISKIILSEFHPPDLQSYFSWTSTKGKYVCESMRQEESWKRLSGEVRDMKLPFDVDSFRSLLPLLWLIQPVRMHSLAVAEVYRHIN